MTNHRVLALTAVLILSGYEHGDNRPSPVPASSASKSTNSPKQSVSNANDTGRSPTPTKSNEEENRRDDRRTTQLITEAGQQTPTYAFWLQVLPNLLGALFGAILAIPVGLWLDRQIKARELNKRKSLILRSLLDELLKNKRSLEDFINKEKRDADINYPEIAINAWKAAQSHTMLPDISDYDMHKILIQTYDRLEFIASIGQSLWAMFFNVALEARTLEGKLKVLNRILLGEAQEIMPTLVQTITQIEDKLNASKTASPEKVR